MKRLTASQRKALMNVSVSHSVLVADQQRRFCNALRVVIASDMQWINWVTKNFPKRLTEINDSHLFAMESRARELAIEGYAFSEYQRREIIENKKMIFTDEGTLVQV